MGNREFESAGDAARREGAPLEGAPLEGAELAARLAATDLTTLNDHDVVEHAAEVEQLVSWAVSLRHDVYVELARRPMRPTSPDDDVAELRKSWAEPGEHVREHASDELAARTSSTARTIDLRMEVALALTRLPATAAALRSGRIDLARAQVIVKESACLDDEVAAAEEARWAEQAAHLTPRRLGRLVRREALRADADAARKRERRAFEERRVVVTPADDGMAELWALLPAADAVRVREVLTSAARAERASTPGEERSLDQLRADVLAGMFEHAASTGEVGVGRTGGSSCEIQVAVAATTMLGLDDQPGELAGYGPITAEAVRELAPDSALRRLITDPVTGEVLDVGRTQYRPNAAIERHVRVSRPRCTFPGCEQPARRSELDHVVPFPVGPTSVENLRPRCKRHHLLKHSPGVEVEELDDGTTRWRLPTGHVHYNLPEPPLPPPEPPPPPEVLPPPDPPPDGLPF